ncbi:HNH endonuclease family protein [Actinomadura sp. WAC 06369]|uniref:HNH endonuclease family protein n=1 Tax=Actinomadura sp. WAC 06369 TaxID=2203193 RepID=UPI000F7B4F48|nr:HNH endonuclease family protein [Actinomadura sp. WAC 06369]RSN53333.1 HNH endonuclease [Actinomadura sp. WAC 06369]
MFFKLAVVRGTARLGAVAALLAVPGALCGTAAADATSADATAQSTTVQTEQVPLREAIGRLEVAPERRDGYDREAFKHWVDADRDGCDTRREVLLAEAVQAPELGGRCRLVGGTGTWHSYYDDVQVTGSRGLDIDHLVPLAESWDSGAHAWDAGRREAYANDLDDPRALIAVTARSNRSKSDQDPREWLPPHAPALCRYIGEWTAIKLRWALSADGAEKTRLTELAADCPDDPIEIVFAG